MGSSIIFATGKLQLCRRPPKHIPTGRHLNLLICCCHLRNQAKISEYSLEMSACVCSLGSHCMHSVICPSLQHAYIYNNIPGICSKFETGYSDVISKLKRQDRAAGQWNEDLNGVYTFALGIEPRTPCWQLTMLPISCIKINVKRKEFGMYCKSHCVAYRPHLSIFYWSHQPIMTHDKTNTINSDMHDNLNCTI